MSHNEKMNDDLMIIKQFINIFDDNRIRFNDIGWASRAYLIDDGRIVFKFPRDNEARQDYAREVETLKLIKPHFSNTPKIEWSNENNDYIGFYGVVGEPLDEEFPSRPNVDQQKVGADLGEFLRELHALTPPDNASKMTLRDVISEHQDKYKKSSPELRKYLTDVDLRRVDDLFMREMPSKILELGEKPVFCHGDLQGQNVIVRDDGSAGIIDFGDAGICDQSIDFAWFEGEILESMLVAYGDDEVLR